jgi:flagellar biosynthesis protein FliP
VTSSRDNRGMDALLSLASHGRASLPIDVLAALTLLSIAPFVLVLSTSFVVVTGLAAILTCTIIAPTFEAISHDALEPYAAGRISQHAFLDRATPMI